MKTGILKIVSFGSMALIVPILACTTLLEKCYGTPFALDYIYHSWWFIALWTVLAVSAMVYILRTSRRCTLIMLHTSFAVILLGAFLSFLTSQHGSIILAKDAVPASMFTTDDGRLEKLPFSLQLANIDTIYSENSAQPCDYKAEVILDNRQKSQRQTVSLNNPMKFEGYSLCIKGGQESHLSLLIAHDTIGLPLSYIGYVMMFVSFIALLLDKQGGFTNILQQLRKENKKRSKTAIFITNRARELFIITTVLICFRWYKTGLFPVSNGAESMMFLAWVTSIFATIFKFKKQIAHITPILVILSAVTFLIALISGWGKSNDIQPILRSPLLGIHVTTIIIAYALLCCTAINAIIALCSKNKEKRKSLALFGRALLYPATMLLATGIFIGAVWANISWGRYWGWDPKEVWALATLLVCSFTFHTHSLPFMAKPNFFHIFCIVIALMMLFTYLGVSLLLGGMHSYI